MDTRRIQYASRAQKEEFYTMYTAMLQDPFVNLEYFIHRYILHLNVEATNVSQNIVEIIKNCRDAYIKDSYDARIEAIHTEDVVRFYFTIKYFYNFIDVYYLIQYIWNI